MSYAQDRKIIDADSHVIELDDFLHEVASKEHKDLIPLMSAQKSCLLFKQASIAAESSLRKDKKIQRLWLNLKRPY